MANIKEIAFSLLQEGFSQKDNHEFSIASEFSMRPVFDKKDILVIKKGEIRTGDIILYKHKKRICAHRCIKVSKSDNQLCYIAKGDNVPYSDGKKLEEKDVLGKIAQIKRGNKLIDLDSRLWRTAGYSISIISLIQSKLVIIGQRYKKNKIVRQYNHMIFFAYRFFLRWIISLTNGLYSFIHQ